MSGDSRVDRRRDHRIAAALCDWFRANARDLPWRRKRDGYTALVAEAMLQQTQVSRVLEKYDAFMQRFPTVQALASADEQSVLAAWNGLGYYRRARHLHAAARAVIEQHGGAVPADVDELTTLPGVGRYTAGSIASIVHGQREPIVDGNVHRVLARLDARDVETGDAAAMNDTWQRADELVRAAADPGCFNEGLMELGATICTPRGPKCDRCPLKRLCRAKRRGITDRIPRPKRRTDRPTVHHHSVVITRGERVLIEQRPSSGLWANMWQTPTVEADERLDDEIVRERVSVSLRRLAHLADFEHGTTHRRVMFHVYRGSTSIRRGRWVRIGDLEKVSMSNAHHRVLELAVSSASVG